MKTIIARFTELKTNVSKANSEFDDLDYNKVDKALKSVGINIKDANGQFRNLDTIFLELSEKWNTLDRNTQRYIATTAAGSRQQSRFIAMMEDYERTMELVEIAQDSAGRSEQQFSKYADTLTHKINSLKNTYEQLKISLLDADIFKSLIDSANNALTKISKLDFKVLVPSMTALIPIIKSFVLKLINSIKKSSTSFLNVGKEISKNIADGINNGGNKVSNKVLSKILGIPETQKEIERLKEEINRLNSEKNSVDVNPNINYDREIAQRQQSLEREQARLARSNEKFAERQKKLTFATSKSIASIAQSAAVGIGIIISGGTIEDALNATGAMILAQAATTGVELLAQTVASMVGVNTAVAAGTATATTTATVGGESIGAGLGRGIETGLASTGVGLIVVAITAAIGLALLGISKYVAKVKAENKSITQQIEDAQERLRDAEAAARDAESQAKSSKQEFKNAEKLKEEYEDLQKIKYKTTEEQERYNELTKEISSQYPSIVTYYNEMTGELNVQKNLWDEILKDSKELAKKDSEDAFLKNEYLLSQQQRLSELQYEEANNNYENLKSIKDNYDDIEAYDLNPVILYGNRQSLSDYFNSQNIELSNSQLDYFEEIKDKYFNGDLKPEDLKDKVSDVLDKITDELLNERNQKQEISNADEKKATISNLQETLSNTNSNSNEVNKIIAAMAVNSGALTKVSGKDIVYDENDRIINIMYDSKEAFDADSEENRAKHYNNLKNAEEILKYAEENDLTDEQKEAIDSLQKNVSQLTISEIENEIAFISSSLNDESGNIQNMLKEDLVNSTQAIAEKLKAIYHIDPTELSSGAIQAFSSQIDAFSQNYGDRQTKNFVNGISNLSNDYKLGMETLTELFTLKWDNLKLNNIEDYKENVKEILNNSDAILSEEDIEAIYTNLIQSLKDSKIVSFAANDIGMIVDDTIANYEQKIEKSDKISKIISTQIEDGFVSAAESKTFIDTLKEFNMDAEKYLTYTKDGIIIDVQAFDNDFVGPADGMETIIDQTIEYNKEKINALDTEKRSLNLILSEVKAQKLLNDEQRESLELLGIKVSNQNDYSTVISQLEKEIDSIDKEKELLEDTNNEYAVGQEKREEAINKYMGLQKALLKSQEEAIDKVTEKIKKAQDAVDKAQKKVDDDADKVQKALEKINEAQEKVIEAQDKLNEALYGSEYRKSSLDGLYNYTTNLGRLEKKANDAKAAIDDLETNPRESVDSYLSNTKGWITTQKAENRVRQTDIDNNLNVLDQGIYNKIAELNAQNPNRNLDVNVRDYYTKVGDRINVNFAAIADAQLPDDFKSYIEERIEDINKQYDAIEQNEDKIKEKEKELKDIQKKIRSDYIKLEEKVINTLKEKYEEEIKDKEDKNKALEQADNDYLDALKKNIDKQRKLRDEEDARNNLATKQKKLSLMQRDTSGSNKKDIQKLREEVEKDQRTLFDKNVDNIIDGLKELYELQKETREAEIEYQKNVLDNAALLLEADRLINSWEGPEDMYEWMLNNQKDLSEMTQAQLEEEQESWDEMFRAKELYMISTADSFSTALITQESEIQEVIANTSEALTLEAERSLNEITSKVDDAIKSVEDALKNAIQGVADARDGYNDAVKALEEDKLDLAEKIAELNQIQAQALQSNISTSGISSNNDRDTNSEQSKQFFSTANSLAYRSSKESILETIEKSLHNPNDLIQAIAVYKSLYGNESLAISEQQYKTFSQYPLLKSKTFHNPNAEGGYLKFATGGIVDYTGPAWVDGTPSKPEAFLSAEDTERIGNAAKLLSTIQILNTQNNNTPPISSNIGDTSIEIHINVENISSDYDVDRLADRVKQDIISAANPIGTSVILNKR